MASNNPRCFEYTPTDIFDPNLAHAMEGTTGDDGTPGAMTLYDFKKHLRNQPEWEQAVNGRRTIINACSSSDNVWGWFLMATKAQRVGERLRLAEELPIREPLLLEHTLKPQPTSGSGQARVQAVADQYAAAAANAGQGEDALATRWPTWAGVPTANSRLLRQVLAATSVILLKRSETLS